jgi:hypothetical protein
MNKCQKCNVQLGIMIEDELGTLCIACHPTAFNFGLKKHEILENLKNVDFKNVREGKYE